MLGALAIFGEGSFIFLWIAFMTKSLEAGCTFEEVVEKKMSKDECESFYNQIRISHFTNFLGAKNPLKLLYFIMILNTISLLYKA
jgi:hypothetical protein